MAVPPSCFSITRKGKRALDILCILLTLWEDYALQLGLPESSVPMKRDGGNKEGNVVDGIPYEKTQENRAARVTHSVDGCQWLQCECLQVRQKVAPLVHAGRVWTTVQWFPSTCHCAKVMYRLSQNMYQNFKYWCIPTRQEIFGSVCVERVRSATAIQFAQLLNKVRV